jgi:hypothetical protein
LEELKNGSGAFEERSLRIRASFEGFRMTKPIARDLMYRGRSFDADVIELCVRWYITYRLSYRDLVAMMAERGESWLRFFGQGYKWILCRART